MYRIRKVSLARLAATTLLAAALPAVRPAVASAAPCKVLLQTTSRNDETLDRIREKAREKIGATKQFQLVTVPAVGFGIGAFAFRRAFSFDGRLILLLVMDDQRNSPVCGTLRIFGISWTLIRKASNLSYLIRPDPLLLHPAPGSIGSVC